MRSLLSSSGTGTSPDRARTKGSHPHDRSEDRRTARGGRLQVHVGDPGRQAGPRDQLLLLAARRSPRARWSSSGRRGLASSSALAGRRVLLGVTGGIAAYKACILTRLLTQSGADVQVVMTPAATRFVGPDTFAALSGRQVHSDVFEDVETVLHVRLAREADVVVVAPT